MVTLRVILLVLALVCFLLAALGVSAPRVSLENLGLAFATAALLAT